MNFVCYMAAAGCMGIAYFAAERKASVLILSGAVCAAILTAELILFR